MEGHTCEEEDVVVEPSNKNTPFQAPATISVDKELTMGMVCKRFAR
jgi:hypothetical protein